MPTTIYKQYVHFYHYTLAELLRPIIYHRRKAHSPHYILVFPCTPYFPALLKLNMPDALESKAAIGACFVLAESASEAAPLLLVAKAGGAET